MRDEIISGLKNGLARGESLEQAKQSFINAGYNPQEVVAAGNSLSSWGGASAIISPQENAKPSKRTELSLPPMPNNTEEKKGGDKTVLILAIVFSILILLGAIGYLIYVLLA